MILILYALGTNRVKGRRALERNTLNLLAIETSTPQAAVVLRDRSGTVRAAPVDSAQRHGRGLIPAIATLLEQAGLSPRDLDAIAVGLGPGSFTGLRVGIMAAKTLAYAGCGRLVGLDSLAVFARQAPPEALHVAVAGDAQRGELFVADFLRDAPALAPRRIAETRLVPAADWAASLPPGTAVVGPLPARLNLAFPQGVLAQIPGAGVPEPHALLEVALDALADGREDDPYSLEPLYIRRSAAEEKAPPPTPSPQATPRS